MRYLHTSTINSLLLGTPLGASPGWLFGTEFSFSKGKHKGKHLDEYDQVSEEKGSESTKATEIKTQALSDKLKIRSPRDILKSPCLAKLRNKCKKKKIPQNVEIESETESGFSHSNREQSKIKRLLSGNLTDIVEGPSLKNNSRITLTKPKTSIINKSPHTSVLDYSQFVSDSNKSPKLIYRHEENQANPFQYEQAVTNEQPRTQIVEGIVKENDISLHHETKDYVGDLDFNTKRIMFENINSGREAVNENTNGPKYQGQKYDVVTVADRSVCPSVPVSEDDSPLFFKNYMNSKT